jgi:hypothetical protein
LGAFAVPEFGLSAGAGGYLTNGLGFTGTVGKLAVIRMIMSNEYIGIGGFLFLDAAFGELSLGFLAAVVHLMTLILPALPIPLPGLILVL